MSGGRATVQAKKGVTNLMQSGDISAVDSAGYLFIESFYVELKCYKDLGLHSLLFGKPTKNSILDFWKQTQVASIIQKKDPILIAKQNRFDTLLCVSITSKIGKWLAKDWLKGDSPTMMAVYPLLDLVIFKLDEFFEDADPEVLLHLYNKLSIVK